MGTRDDTITGGAGHGPDKPIDLAVSMDDEEPAFAGTTPGAPPISPPGHDDLPSDGGRDEASGVPEDLSRRSAAEVLEDHLREGKHGSVDSDLPRNYAPDLVVLTGDAVFRGYEGMRHLARKLRAELPEASFTYKTKAVDGRLALLEWSGESPAGRYVDDGADSYLIENGKIVAQTIHYTVKSRTG